MSRLPAETVRLAGRRSARRTGVITAVTALAGGGTAVAVAVGGAIITNAGVLGSYAPVVGDVVSIDTYNNSWVILGRVPAPGQPARPAARQYDGAATAGLAAVPALTDVPGAVAKVEALNDGAVYLAVVTFRFDRASSTSAAIAVGRLFVDGVLHPRLAPAQISTAAAHAGISTATQSYPGVLTAGEHEFRLAASCAAAGVWTAVPVDTHVSVLVIG